MDETKRYLTYEHGAIRSREKPCDAAMRAASAILSTIEAEHGGLAHGRMPGVRETAQNAFASIIDDLFEKPATAIEEGDTVALRGGVQIWEVEEIRADETGRTRARCVRETPRGAERQEFNVKNLRRVEWSGAIVPEPSAPPPASHAVSAAARLCTEMGLSEEHVSTVAARIEASTTTALDTMVRVLIEQSHRGGMHSVVTFLAYLASVRGLATGGGE